LSLPQPRPSKPIQTPLLNQHQLPFETPFFYGWLIVALAALGVFFSGPGQTFSISVFVDEYVRDLGLSRSLVSSLYSSATLVAGFLLFGVGRLVDVFGQRAMMVCAGLALAAAAVFNSLITMPWTLFVGFFVLRLFGQGSMSLIPITLVPQWFVTKRGRAFSLMSLGGIVGAAAIPPLNAWDCCLMGLQIGLAVTYR